MSKATNVSVAQDLQMVENGSLNDLEKALRQRALFDARAQAVGAFSRDSFGGADMESACEVIALDGDILRGYKDDKGRPKIFANDEEVLREVNSVYLNNTTLKWLDVGTAASAVKLPLCRGLDSDVHDYVGDPVTHEVAKDILLLRNWWTERVLASEEAQRKCSVYSGQDRTQIWEAFSADQHFNNDNSSSMGTYKAQLNAYRAKKIAYYRHVAKLALQQVFPDDTTLTPAQRPQVLAALDRETAFGLLPDKVALALDAAQGTLNGTAAKEWRNDFKENVQQVGGQYGKNDPVRPADEAAIKDMFAEVKTWLAKRYQGYPIDVGRMLALSKLKVTTKDDSETISGGSPETKNGVAEVYIGVGTARSKMEYYSLIIHEIRHAVNIAWQSNAPDKSKVATDMGLATEGSGVAAETLLLEPFLKQSLHNDVAYSLYALDYGIRDARFAGTTDATLQRYFRSGCSGANEPNTIDFAKGIAKGYGLTGALADTAALRSHAGTQYLQYILGGLQVLDDIAYLQSEVDATGQHRVDPYVLFACGLNTPRRDSAYVAALRACMNLKR
jgi:hypothetical protein